MFHHKKKNSNFFQVMLAKFVMVTILEYINISDHYTFG